MESKNKKPKYSTNILHNAAHMNDHISISNILNNDISLLNTLDERNRTPLQVACQNKSNKAVDAILKFPGVNINNKDCDGDTALVTCWTEWRMASKLLKYPGIDVLVKHCMGQSIIYMFLQYVNERKYINTSRSQIFKVVMLYLRLPAALTWRGNIGENIVHCFVMWNNPELLKAMLLINHDLISKHDTYCGETPLYRSCGDVGNQSYSCEIKHNKHIECLNMLLHNIDDKTLNMKNRCGGTALHAACWRHNPDNVKILLQHPEIDVNIFDDNGHTPLFRTICAPESRFKRLKTTGLTWEHHAWNMTVLRLLMDHNVFHILARDGEGHQLLYYACRRLELICDVPVTNQNETLAESLTTDFLKIIDEIEVFMAKARWSLFQYIYDKKWTYKLNDIKIQRKNYLN
jgi:Ankyrin repeats (many copies)